MKADSQAGESIETLVAMLGDRDGMKRLRARAELVARGRPAAEALVGLMDSDDAWLRWEAAKALGEIADPVATDALIQALEDEDQDVRWLAAEGLARIGRPALPALMRVLIDRSKHVDLREGAHHVLHALEDPDTRELVAPVYMELSGPSPATDVIPAADKVLRKLQ